MKSALIFLIVLTVNLLSCASDRQTDYRSYGPLLQKSFIWMKEPSEKQDKSQSVGFRKEFEINSVPRDAKMMIFADSRYVLWINGSYVERGPCRFDPKGPQYDIVDIHNHLRKGKNTIAVLVHGNVKNIIGNLKIMRHLPGFTAAIQAGGEQIVTDNTWSCSDQIPEQMWAGIWTWSCVLDSVNTNSTGFGWQKPGFDDTMWSRSVPVPGATWGPLTARYIPLLMETDLGSGTILQIKNGKARDTSPKKLPEKLPVRINMGDEVVIDVGKLSLTYWSMQFQSGKGAEIIFTPCQDFVNGETIINYNCVSRITAREGSQSFLSTETFGFRYLNIKVMNGSIELDSIRFISRLYPAINLAKFSCSDDFLNHTWEQDSYTSRVLCEDGYVDSAERAEWMADVAMIQYPVSRAVISGPGAHDGEILFSDPRLLHNMLLHTAQSQQEDGRLKAHSPSDRFDLHWYIEDYSCLWVEGLRQYYENTADSAFLGEMWPVLGKQINWFLERKNRTGLITGREFLLHLDNPLRYQTCQGATVNAFIYKALADASWLAEKIGRKEESGFYRLEADSLKAAYNRYLWDEISRSYFAAVYYPDLAPGAKIPELRMALIEDPASKIKTWSDGNVQWMMKGTRVTSTVQAALAALDRGIVGDDHLNEVRKYLIRHCGELKNPYTHRMLFDELYRYDQDSLDIKVLDIIRTRWHSMVSRVSPGTAAEGFETQGYLCHPFGLIPAYVLPGYVLGVRKPEPVWNRTIQFEPRPGDLSYAQGVALTEFGPVPAGWQKEGDGTFKFHIEVPDRTEAVIHIPEQGLQNEVLVNGERVQFAEKGRFVEFRLKSGRWQGQVTGR